MAPPPGRIYSMCTDLLAVVVARHGATLPDRQYVAAGAPAWDCELLATWCETTRGAAGAGDNAAATPWSMRDGTFVVTMVRCVPMADIAQDGSLLTLPTEAAESAAAELLYNDAQRMLNAVVAGHKAGELGGCHGLALLDWRVLGPAAGLVAGELRLALSLSAG